MSEELLPNKVFVAIDPAMANTGLAMWCEGDDEISTAHISPSEKSTVNDFQSVYRAGKEITSTIGGILRQISLSGVPIEVVMEHPPPHGTWAAGLCLVDALILSRVHRLGLSPYLIHPTRINTLLTSTGSPKVDKSLQRKTKFSKVERREYLLEILELNKLGVRRKPKQRPNKKLTGDEADAGLLLVYLIHNLHHRLTLPEGFVTERWLLKEFRCLG